MFTRRNETKQNQLIMAPCRCVRYVTVYLPAMHVTVLRRGHPMRIFLIRLGLAVYIQYSPYSSINNLSRPKKAAFKKERFAK